MYLTAIAVAGDGGASRSASAARPARAFLARAAAPRRARSLLGAINVWLGEHAGLIVAHLTLGTLLWATVVYAIAYAARRPPAPRPERARGRRGDRAQAAAGLTPWRARRQRRPRWTLAIEAGIGAPLAARRRARSPVTVPRLRRADQAADHLAAAAHHRGDDVRRRPAPARRSRRSSGRCSAATWPPAAPGRSTTTSSATATRAWRAPAAGRWSPAGSSRGTGSSSGSRSGRSRSLELALTVNVLAAAARARRAARLRVRLHALAEAADAAEHRDRRRRRAPCRRWSAGPRPPAASPSRRSTRSRSSSSGPRPTSGRSRC